MTDIDIEKCAEDARAACTNASLVMPWADLGESSKEYYRGCARAVLESAGVKRLRAELKIQTDRIGELQRKQERMLDALVATEQARDEQKARADRAERLEREFRAEVDRAFRKHGLSADPNCVDRLVEQRDAEKARADRAVEAWKEASGYDDLLSAYSAAGDRIAALEKAVEAADVLLESHKGLWGGWSRESQTYSKARAAIDSAQPAPDAGKCAQPSEHHESCNCENQPAPDARDERIRELESECGLAEALLEVSQGETKRLEDRIRVACAELRQVASLLHLSVGDELRRIARALEGKDSGQPAAATTADPKGAGESSAETAPAGCSSATHPTPWRVGSKVGRNVYDARDAPVVMMPDEQTAERVVAAMNGEESRRAWVSETHAKLEAAANLRTLCMLAAQYETTVMARDFRSGGGLTVALNNPSTKYNGPDYARGLVERMRARLEETR